MSTTVNGIRVSLQAHEIAKEKAKEQCISLCEWVSKAIMEKAVLDELVECKKLEEV